MLEEAHNFFPQSVNPVINGGTFASVQGDLHVVASTRNAPIGLKNLLEKIATGAFHDSSERDDPPRCHPDTRKAILKEIIQWIKSPEARREFILWLQGPAGAGKSAIAQSIAEVCQKEGLLAASFFFSRTAPGRNGTSRFVVTIAYQLARHFPAIKEHILAAIEEDPAIFSRALSTQVRTLLVEPFKVASAHGLLLLSHPALVVVDGLDECGDGQAQKTLLDVLGTLIVELQHLPLIFIITSRPEYEIRQAFDEQPLLHSMKRIVLDDSYNPDQDIKIYLGFVFDNIKRKSSSFAIGYSLSSWPMESDMTILVEKASGQFIFAATVAKFVDSPRHNPIPQLQIILGHSMPGKDTPFALLDALYRSIISSVANIEEVLEVLTLLILSSKSYTKLSVEVVEELLGFDIRRALMDMHALMFVPPTTSTNVDTEPLRLHHPSIYDFLVDKSRSEQFWIDSRKGHGKIAIHWLRLIGRYKESKISKDIPLNVCFMAFYHYCTQSPSNPELAMEMAAFNLRTFLEVLTPNSELYTNPWNEFFFCAKQQGGDRVDVYPRLQDEFDSFIHSRFSQYQPNLRPYIPTVALMQLKDVRDSFWAPYGIIHLLLYTHSKSVSHLEEIRTLDASLLSIDHLSWAVKTRKKSVFEDFLKNKNRAGKFYVDEVAFANIANRLISILYPSPDTRDNDSNKDGEFLHSHDATKLIVRAEATLRHVAYAITKAALDPSLVILLRDRALQYDPNSRGQRDISVSSLKYLQKSSQPYDGHPHRSNTDNGLICEACSNTVVSQPLPDPVKTAELHYLPSRPTHDLAPPTKAKKRVLSRILCCCSSSFMES